MAYAPGIVSASATTGRIFCKSWRLYMREFYIERVVMAKEILQSKCGRVGTHDENMFSMPSCVCVCHSGIKRAFTHFKYVFSLFF